MIPRYSDDRITAIFSDQAKVLRWQEVELAVIAAREKLELIPNGVHQEIKNSLEANPCDVDWWLQREKKTNHDLAAFIDERLRFIPVNLHAYWHEDMTSYDTEDPAASLALFEAAMIVNKQLDGFIELLSEKALLYRYTPMLGRTHGQWAKLRTFGSRILTWIQQLRVAKVELARATLAVRQSRLSGAIGNYGGGLTPDIERMALKNLNLFVFPGATQILPRIVQAPLAQALRLTTEALGQVAMDFRLGARSGKPLWQEPFGKEQKGSSAMPHKKNTISTEHMGGMANLAAGFELSITLSIRTWEERGIEQSCVERVAWPDLFHVTLRMLTVMTKVIGGMQVYPDHMVEEINASLGTYASDEAKNFLAKECAKRGVPFETAYRIVQTASFNVFKADPLAEQMRRTPSTSRETMDHWCKQSPNYGDRSNIRSLIHNAELQPVEELGITEEQVGEWNKLLSSILEDGRTREAWTTLFLPSRLLKQEDHLFETILGKK